MSDLVPDRSWCKIDSLFEIACARVRVLVARHEKPNWRGDLADLVAALEEARALGAKRVNTKRERSSSLPVWADANDDLRELQMIDGLLAKIRQHKGV
jgi:hypothetical protein